MIRNVKRPRHAPATDPDAAHEDPVGVKAESGATPGRDVRRKRCRKIVRLHQSSNLDGLLFRESIEVAHHDYRTVVLPRLVQHCFGLLMLIVERAMWIDVNVEQAEL